MIAGRSFRIITTGAALLLTTSIAFAATPCRTSGPFNSWLENFKQEALAQGISRSAIAQASPYLVYDQRIVNIDRGQRVFSQSFLEFSGRMVPGGRISQGQAQLQKNAANFARAEKEYGVPAAVIAAFWGLESDFGANQGKDHSIRSIVSLAYDCRRADMFREHLFSGLKLLDRGDLAVAEMVGSWAGELGQTQMMPSEYFKYAVDYDGDGHRNLLRSPADVIGSTANYIKALGWKRGEPCLSEIRVPQNLPWQEAGLDVKHPRSQWAKWGVTLANGQPLPSDGLPASVVLPMGRRGPAFLAYDNFQVYLTWNNSLVYSLTAAYYANRIAGAAAMQRGAADIPPVTMEMTRELQQILTRMGYNVGTVDGKLGLASRQAVKAAQIKLGLPADSYPTPELLQRLRNGR
jgi:lytic murein transglycosylase